MDITNEQPQKCCPELLAQANICDKLADKITSWKSKTILNQCSKEDNFYSCLEICKQVINPLSVNHTKWFADVDELFERV